MNELAKEEMDDFHKTEHHVHIVSDSMALGNMHVSVAKQTGNMGSSETVSHMHSTIPCVMQSVENEVQNHDFNDSRLIGINLSW